MGTSDFGPAAAFPAGANPAALAIADFDGDGNPDVAVTGSGSLTAGVSVLLGNGQGGLGSAATDLPGQAGGAVAAADLNGDGHPDLIVGTSNSTGASGSPPALTVLLNNVNGTFDALPPVYSIAAGNLNGIVQILTGDFNRDGKMDLAVLQQNQNSQIQILLGNGDGTFRTGQLLATEFGGNAAVVADLNGDGYPDLVVGHCCGETDDTYLLGNGDGTFRTEMDFPAGASAQALAIADWAGTGKVGLAVVGQINGSLGSSSANVRASRKRLSAQTATIGYFLALENSFPPTVLSGASFSMGALAPSEIVTLKGELLAASTAAAFPLPTTEGGATVTLTDSTGNSQAAPLYYVSPTQINFEVPASVALGEGLISLTESDGTPVSAAVMFANSAPGIFELNLSALAAAEALVINGSSQTFEQVYQVGSGNNIVPLPIDLSQGQVYLVLYGTGIRNAKDVTVSVGGQSVSVPFFGAQGTYAGEDQINVGPLPGSLAGKGNVTIALTADGQAANTVTVQIK